MTEEKAENLIDYLQELWLWKPTITKELLESEGLTRIDVRGQISPTDTDQIKFQYNIYKLADGFSVSKYKAYLLDISPIAHVKDQLVDSAKTEETLQSINWNQSPAELNSKIPNIEDTVSEVLFMKAFDHTKDIADRLMIKYWYNTPMEDHVNLSGISGLPMPKELTVSLTGNSSDIDLKESFALLSGRSVMKVDLEELQAGEIPTSHWLLYEDGKIIQLPAFDIDKIIRSLPHQNSPDEKIFTEIMTRLIAGELATVQLIQHGKSITGFIEADPKARYVNFYTEDGQRIDLENSFSMKQDKASSKTNNQKQSEGPKRKGPRL